ncbi:hypothetical protein BgiMline_001098, partial [Biomphalaria glabrata]
LSKCRTLLFLEDSRQNVTYYQQLKLNFYGTECKKKMFQRCVKLDFIKAFLFQ